MNNLKTTIETRIVALAASEKVTKAELGHISRELLAYVPDSNDIAMVNRLLDVLTPMNKTTAGLFFQAFLPWKYDGKSFGKKLKGEGSIQKKLSSIENFLKDEDNNIWTWAEKTLDITARPKNYASKISKLVKRALSDEKEGIDARDIIGSVMQGGVNVADLIDIMEAIKIEVDAIEQSDRETEAA